MLPTSSLSVSQALAGTSWVISTHTARSYNIINVNHRHQILATTTGYPARWNNKTLTKFDPFMQGLHEGKVLDNIEFNLYEYNKLGAIILQPYCGGWLLVDNEYLACPTNAPQSRQPKVARAEICFSAWLESLKKDVECTYGILKGIGVFSRQEYVSTEQTGLTKFSSLAAPYITSFWILIA